MTTNQTVASMAPREVIDAHDQIHDAAVQLAGEFANHHDGGSLDVDRLRTQVVRLVWATALARQYTADMAERARDLALQVANGKDFG